MSQFELKLLKQCAKCPWKKSTNPHDIPDGYCETKHKALAATIKSGIDSLQGPLQIMACHHSYNGNEFHCIGWLHNQLGVGNNIGLRIAMRNCTNLHKIKVVGDQHQRFEETLPS